MREVIVRFGVIMVMFMLTVLIYRIGGFEVAVLMILTLIYANAPNKREVREAVKDALKGAGNHE